MKRTALASLTVFSIACGGLFQSNSDSGSGGDGSADGVLGADGGWTKCEAPSGVSICGGPNNCGAQCTTGCYEGTSSDLNVCWSNDFLFQPDASVASDEYLCPDGALNACVADKNAPSCWRDACTTNDLPALWLMNGRPDLARYADRSTYTGAPLPSPPTSCPSVSQGLTLCGGGCASAWSPDETCTGRSPLHPYSMIVPKEPTTFPCSRGNGNYCDTTHAGFMCLTYKVDDASQTIADQNSLCVPGTLCQAAAASYPGGAFCTAGNP